MTSSSNHYGLYRAAYGRLNGYRGGGWCSHKTDSDSEWLQVDIGEIIQGGITIIQNLFLLYRLIHKPTPTQKQHTNYKNNELNLHSLGDII